MSDNKVLSANDYINDEIRNLQESISDIYNEIYIVEKSIEDLEVLKKSLSQKSSIEDAFYLVVDAYDEIEKILNGETMDATVSMVKSMALVDKVREILDSKINLKSNLEGGV